MRVVVSIVVFALERDRLFVAITVLVLAILLVSNFLLGPMGAHEMRNEKHQLVSSKRREHCQSMARNPGDWMVFDAFAPHERVL